MPRQGNIDRSQRQLRVGEQIRQVLIETIQRGHLHDADLETHLASITISEVRISPDLKNATAFTTSLLNKDLEKIVEALNNNVGYFKKELSSKLNLKYMPQIKFTSDELFDEAEHIENLLRKVKDET